VRWKVVVTRSVVSGVAVVAFVASAQTGTQARERIVGLPCEDCDAVFVGLPASVDEAGRIAPANLRGEPLQLYGRVLDRSGVPVAGVIVYAYHTDSTGIYPPDVSLTRTPAAPHGKLRGWARSNARGEYRFATVRPGPYPGRPDPQHLHTHVLEVGRCTYYIGNVEFTDDPRLTSELRECAELQRGGSGVATPVRDPRDIWQIERDIHLGLNIPGYAACATNG
jgi:protocatechuate 3,4-dioxygenase beta subunit